MSERVGIRRCNSELVNEEIEEEDPREVRSYPMTPKGLKEYEEFRFDRPESNEFGQIDNVYAEAKEPVPQGLKSKVKKVDVLI